MYYGSSLFPCQLGFGGFGVYSTRKPVRSQLSHASLTNCVDKQSQSPLHDSRLDVATPVRRVARLSYAPLRNFSTRKLSVVVCRIARGMLPLAELMPRIADKATITLRFAKGDRVEASVGRTFAPGKIAELFYCEQSFPPERCAAYGILLDSGKSLYTRRLTTACSCATSSRRRHRP